MHAAIEIHSLTVFNREKPVLVDINISLEKEQIVALVGPRKAGKTTFFKVILGLVQADIGTVRIDGVDVGHGSSEVSYMPTRETVRFDFPATLMEFTLLGRSRKTPWFLSLTSRDRNFALDALAAVGLADSGEKQTATLSYGEQQRLLLARSIAQGGDLLLLDEPFLGVDSTTEVQMCDILLDLYQQGKTIIIGQQETLPLPPVVHKVVLLNKTLGSQESCDVALHRILKKRRLSGELQGQNETQGGRE